MREEERLRKLAERALPVNGAFPTDADEQRACIVEIMAAMNNCDDVVDKPGNDGKRAQAHTRFGEGYYKQQEIEMKAWQLLVSH